MKNFYRLITFPLPCLLIVGLLLPPTTAAQTPTQEVPLDKTLKKATLLEFKAPYKRMIVYVDDDFDNRYGVVTLTENTLFLKRPLGSRKRDKLKPDDQYVPQDIHPGMKVDLHVDHYQISLKNIAREVFLSENYYGQTSVTGLFEGLEGNKAVVDGQAVELTNGTSLRGVAEWKEKKFTAFSEMQLGSEVDLHGKREPDGIVYASRGTVRPVEATHDDRLLRRGVDQALKVDKSALRLGKAFTRQYITDIRQQDYVNTVGRRVIPAYLKKLPIEHPDYIGFKFYLVNDESFNASAFPNGAVIIHTGLLKNIENEAQLAAILGHEIAHVTQKHHAKIYRKRKNWNATRDVLMTVSAVTVGTAPALLVGLTTEMYVSNYSRAQETQADRIGLRYMHDAGYDPREAAAIWRKLARIENEGADDVEAQAFVRELTGDTSGGKDEVPEDNRPVEQRQSVYASHPRARDRFNHVNFLLSTAYANADFANKIANADEYQQFLSRLGGKSSSARTNEKVKPVHKAKGKVAPKPKKP